MYKIKVMDKISQKGLSLFEAEKYETSESTDLPDAILVRSRNLHSETFPSSLKAVARAGAGVNNIPVDALSERGVVVFNTPGANANAVKELAVLSLLISSRPVVAASSWVTSLSGTAEDIAKAAEKGKSRFKGMELRGKTLGVIGLGAIGIMVANAAASLGMRVVGFDPFMSINAAWKIDRDVRHAESLEEVYRLSDYISIHTPLTDETRGLLDEAAFGQMKSGVRIINLARGELVQNQDMKAAIESGKVAYFVNDFASSEFLGMEKVFTMPHLGASTPEAEENCAVMAATEIKEFLEKGNITNSVNFPRTFTDNPLPSGGSRLCITNKNVKGMVSRFTSVLLEAGVNIESMLNQNAGKVAYNIIDVNSVISAETLEEIRRIESVTSVRVISN